MEIDPHLDSLRCSSIRKRGRALIEIKADEEEDGENEEADGHQEEQAHEPALPQKREMGVGMRLSLSVYSDQGCRRGLRGGGPSLSKRQWPCRSHGSILREQPIGLAEMSERERVGGRVRGLMGKLVNLADRTRGDVASASGRITGGIVLTWSALTKDGTGPT